MGGDKLIMGWVSRQPTPFGAPCGATGVARAQGRHGMEKEPRMRADRVVTLDPAWLPSRPPAGAFVIVIENDAHVGHELARVLVAAGYRARPVEDASAALAVLRAEQNPCLVIFDVAMPGMDGFEFLEVLQSDVRLPEVNVVLLTAMDLGVNEIVDAPVLRKPCPAETLLRVVGRQALPPTTALRSSRCWTGS
jgi:CheY-like chemotaxis protein